MGGRNQRDLFAFSTDNGLTFITLLTTSVRRILEVPFFHKSLLQEITSMWYGKMDTPGNFDIFFAVSTDNGQTFSTPDNLSEEYTGDSNGPQISSSGNNVYVVWTDSTLPGNDGDFVCIQHK